MITLYKTTKCDKNNLKDGEILSEKVVEQETLIHRKGVYDCGAFLARTIKNQFSAHDWTKGGFYLPVFTRALSKAYDSEKVMQEWSKIHAMTERHHLNTYAPDDVNLIDVLEMICDCVCAGKARTGSVYEVAISPKVLMKAFQNTVNYIIKNTVVTDDEVELSKCTICGADYIKVDEMPTCNDPLCERTFLERIK